ncbi:MAG: FAD-dependent oxidoreductase, partial [Gammaproteobacteria bacterium]|nr:FAD-dependent oxidoreductase [Gammaproteobacteria bacterium]
TAAYELKKAGYEVVVLEAAPKAGGRVLTIRSGDLIDEVGNPQVCEFDDDPHIYFNAGAARIPSSHRNLMNYCKELGVELEVFINENKECYFQDDGMYGGKPVKNTEFTTSARGFMAEIMAKSLDSNQLDEPLNQWEMETLMGVVRSFGDLTEDQMFKGSTRGGYAYGGYLDEGGPKEPLAFRELLRSRFLRNALSENEGETGPILFQPAGGMDKIVDGFVRQLQENIFYNVMVSSVELSSSGVEVIYEHRGTKYQLDADYCFNCIPSHLMAGIQNNFSTDYIKAMRFPTRGTAYKSAFQTKERFWENDDIYGGISWINAPIRQIWYPIQGIHKEKGVVLSAYDFGNGMPFTRLSQEERLEIAIQQGKKLHPDYDQYVEKGITIAWHRMNHMLGCAARWRNRPGGMTAEAEEMFQALRQPAGGRHYMIGDQVTKHSAWQESAILSAHWAINDMVSRLSGGASTMPGTPLS